MSEISQLEEAILALEQQRSVLSDAVVDVALAPMREKLAALRAQVGESRFPGTRQRKQVTVLFADISGFTALAREMDAEDVTELMNAVWQRLDAIILDLGGVIDKHMGDGVMALWGVNSGREDEPERAVRAALHMQDALRTFREERELDLAMRVGVHTGPALLGAIGITAEFTAMGTTVNLASRLEGIAPVDGVLISYETYQRVRGHFDIRPLPPVWVKGSSVLLDVYQVLRIRPRVFHPSTRGVEGVETRMVGRQVEFERLRRAFKDVIEAGAFRVVTIVGEAGIGKSRLLAEFDDWATSGAVAQQLGGFSLFRGRAVENTLRLPYGLLRDVFALLFAIHESDTSELAREKLVAGVVGMMPHDTHATEKAHFIGHLLGLDFSSSAFLRGILEDARQIHDRALHYLGQFLHAAAASGPVVVLLEDLHWADVASLDALVDLLPHVSELPMLVVAVARPTLFERYPQWGTAYAAHQRVELSLLSEDASRQLVSEILKRAESVPVALRDMVVRQAEGNPFYLEELIKVLISDRVILTDSTRWSINVSRLDAIRVPPTLTGVLQAHLDSLPSEERVVLQQASVVGRVFWDEAVRALQTGDTMAAHVDDDLAAILRALEARELIFERAHAGSQEMLALVGGKEYAFKHALFRAVTYETVLKRERSLYHARAAAWLEAHSGARVGEVAGLIGEHAERAGEAREAALWYGRAGKQALEAYAPETAIAFFRRALEIAVDQPDLGADSIPWYAGLAKVLWMRARYPEAIQTYSAMCARAEAMADCDAQARAWNGLAGVHERRGDYRAMFESTQHAEALALRAGDVGSEALATAYFGQGLALYRLGDAQGALALGEQLLALSDSLGDNAAYMRALSLKMLGAAYDMLGRFEEATQCQEQALTLARALGDRRNEGAMLNNLGESARLRGDPVAVERLLAALDVAHEIGDRDGEIARLSNLGGARLLQEDYVTAEADLRRVLEMVGNGNWFGLSETYRFLAEACLGQGKLEEALSAARRALDLAREIGYQELLGGGWRVLGACAARLEQEGQRESGASVPDPRSCFAASLGIFIEIGAEAERARTLREWGRYEIIQGDPQKGVSFWEEARAIFETHQMPCELARTAQFT